MGQSIRNISVKSNPITKNASLFDTPDNRNPLSVLTSMGKISFDDPSLYFEDISKTDDDLKNRVKNSKSGGFKNGDKLPY